MENGSVHEVFGGWEMGRLGAYDVGAQDVGIGSQSELDGINDFIGQNGSQNRLTINTFPQTIQAKEVYERAGWVYTNIDVDERPGTLRVDLARFEIPRPRYAFDLVVNVGTTEHLANPIAAFAFMHEFCVEGGIIYHDVPLFGFGNHGLMNPTPKFWHALIWMNRYDPLAIKVRSIDESSVDSGNLYHDYLSYMEGLSEAKKITYLILKLGVIFSNITFVGADLLQFIYYNCKDSTEAAQLVLFPKDSPAGCSDLHSYMLVTPSWTLGIEIVFYMVAPFLFKKGWYGIFLLLAISITTRMFLFGIGYHSLDWERHFVLSEAVYFACGMVSYRLYKLIPERLFVKKNNWLAAVLIFLWTTMYAYIYIENVDVGDRQIWQTLYHWWFVVIMVVLVPFLFELSKRSKVDFLAGEFSYPIYITHIPTMLFVLPLFRTTLQGFSFSGKMAFSIGVIFAVAFLGIALVSYPVEWLRGRKSIHARRSGG